MCVLFSILILRTFCSSLFTVPFQIVPLQIGQQRNKHDIQQCSLTRIRHGIFLGIRFNTLPGMSVPAISRTGGYSRCVHVCGVDSTMGTQQCLCSEERGLQHVGCLHYQHVLQPPQILRPQAFIQLERRAGERKGKRQERRSCKGSMTQGLE